LLNFALLTIVPALVLGQTGGPASPADLSPCDLTTAEVQAAFGLTVDRTQAADMTFPGGRDVACLYTFKDSSFALNVEQTWGSTPTPASASVGERETVKRPVEGDADGAVFAGAPKDHPGAGGELDYDRGNVHTRLIASGGRFMGADVQQRFLHLRRIP
jgi:hypothetical protein